MKNTNDFLFLNQITGGTVSSLSKIYASETDLREAISSVFEIDENLIRSKSILIKPNWVRHPLKESDEICLTTHPDFILRALEIILEKKPEKIIIGDAPLQSCNWKSLLPDHFHEKISEYAGKYSTPIIIKDFRRVVLDKRHNMIRKDNASLSGYVIFDLGKESILEPVTGDRPAFRVADYDPRRLSDSHRTGMHKYCITRELFEADVVISMPKVKTHQKAGITCALKNLVGLNGDKDFLPHHRVGGTGRGGDCYPGRNYFRRLSEFFLDNANKNAGTVKYDCWRLLSKVFWKINKNQKTHTLSGAWYGNDTTWRMVLDLNKIAMYGKIDGSISDMPQRKIYSLCDGIIGGQGDGPLKPEPLALGVVSFSNNGPLNDAAIASLMGFDIDKMPLVREGLDMFPADNADVRHNGRRISINELSGHKKTAIPPPGWLGHIEKANHE